MIDEPEVIRVNLAQEDFVRGIARELIIKLAERSNLTSDAERDNLARRCADVAARTWDHVRWRTK